MNTRYILLLGMALCVLQGHAQDDIHRKANKEALDSFRKQTREKFENFRQEAMNKYLEFMSNPWKKFEGEAPKPAPKDEMLPPVSMPETDKFMLFKKKRVKVKEVVKPLPPQPQPEPVEPIKDVPATVTQYVDFVFFGTPARVRFDMSERVSLASVNEKDITAAMRKMTTVNYDRMIIDCLALRRDLQLSDWAYLMMLKTLTERISGKGTNESELLTAYVYMQSGYKMRLGYFGNKLYMLFASPYLIYGRTSYRTDGQWYFGIEELPREMSISNVSFPNEQTLTLMIPTNQQFAKSNATNRRIEAENYQNMCINVAVNQNLIDFYDTYPTSRIGDNVMTQWATYANTPMDEEVKAMIYPALSQQLAGLSQLEATNRLLNLVQTGLTYGYDNQIWGGDRVFFAEESLFYPCCDCEDRAILFTRLVRDLLGLECMLVYYPGHLASAVAFAEEVDGDYIEIEGKKFTIADPTYIRASVGITMPNMDNSSATVIVLQ